MAERQKTKFEEELEKLLKLKQQQEEQFNDPFTESVRSYPKLDSFGNVGDVYSGTAMPYDYDANRYKFYGNPNSSKYEDVTRVPFNREYKENYAGHEEYKPSVWPDLAKEGEPAYNDPGLVLRSAAYSNKARRDRNMEAAKGTARKALEDVRNALSPEQHEREMRGVPAGHRAGLMNLYRPQYQADMNESFNAPDMVLNDRAAMESANTPEAEYAYNEAYAEGANERLNALNIKRDRIRKKLDELKAVRHLELTNDPMWAVAKLQYLNENDSTGLNNIMSRIQADIQRKFTEAENEKNRQSTQEIANANKLAEDQAKADDAMQAYENQKEVYSYLVDKYNKDNATMDSKSKAELENQIAQARINLKYKARKAEMEDEYNELIKAAEGSDADRMLNDSINKFFALNGVTADTFKGVYDAASKDQQKKYRDMMAIMQIPEEKLLGEAASVKAENAKKTQTAAAKKKTDFKNTNSSKTFEMNPLTGKPMNSQAWEDFKKEAKAAGWSNIELQNNGAILWK